MLRGQLRIPKAALRILRPLASQAARLRMPAYIVGGCVRDWLLGRPTSDWDVVTEADPKPLAALCGRLLRVKPESFGRFGTLRVISGNIRVDFATSRREEYPEPACLPRVATPAPLREDLVRRDFTVNAMALPLLPNGVGEIVDPCGGRDDLRAGVIRVLHAQSFRDDPTRVFRAARYMCRLGFKPAPGLAALAEKSLAGGHAALLSRHRLAQELMRILGERECGCSLRRLRAWGYLDLVHPGLKAPPRDLDAASERLGAMALSLGPAEGGRFLDSLPIDRRTAGELQGVMRLAAEKASPRTEPSPLAGRLLSWFFPRAPRTALKGLFLSGGDIEALALPPGKRFGEILDEAARLQWSGKLKSRGQALAWLRGRV